MLFPSVKNNILRTRPFFEDFEHFPKSSEDFLKLSDDQLKPIRTAPIIFRKCPKIVADFQRFLYPHYATRIPGVVVYVFYR